MYTTAVWNKIALTFISENRVKNEGKEGKQTFFLFESTELLSRPPLVTPPLVLQLASSDQVKAVSTFSVSSLEACCSSSYFFRIDRVNWNDDILNRLSKYRSECGIPLRDFNFQNVWFFVRIGSPPAQSPPSECPPPRNQGGGVEREGGANSDDGRESLSPCTLCLIFLHDFS